MIKFKCIDCGTIFDENLKACPTCGCPKSDCEEIHEQNLQEEKATQEFQNSSNANDNPVVIQDEDEQDFNENYEYSPFSEDSWFKREPWPLNKYPRRMLAQKHPFLGWLLDPWHLTCNDDSKREAYNTANNIFYMFNLWFKANLYIALYTFFKVWLLIVVLILFLILMGVGILSGSSELLIAMLVLYSILVIILVIVACIAWCWGIGNALHRYWPSFHRTWRRVNKRYWSEMKK